MKTDSNKTEILSQIKNAFEFIQKLYYECSYLIKEIEGQLAETEYHFQILRPSGYSVSARSSTGLEQNNVYFWMPRKFSVAFVEEELTEVTKGQNFTEITDNLKVLYFKFILDGKNLEEPELIFGVLYDIEKYKDWVKKFENLMGTFEYIDNKLFLNLPKIEYTDSTVKLKGVFKKVKLIDINSSLELQNKVIQPIIDLYNNKE